MASDWKDFGEESNTLRALVHRIAEGDLVAVDRVPGDSVRAAPGGMCEGLHGTIAGILHGADAISTASSEIAAGHRDLSTRAERTFPSLQQTASAMEEFVCYLKRVVDVCSVSMSRI
ncbi:hypothetical protein [Hydrogenophaga crassostreae]|uniref:hypothetical protein n=1 Tax=Hydrogenophaga crassostreae TaxID=1763535 RepID=UPI0012FA28C8|nr:hypothetical protein [Hydrogenophaga crassostreae]